MFLIATIWEYLRAFPGVLEQITLEGIFDSAIEVFLDPECALPLIFCLLTLWTVIVLLKVTIGAIDEAFSGDGIQRLGL